MKMHMTQVGHAIELRCADKARLEWARKAISACAEMDDPEKEVAFLRTAAGRRLPPLIAGLRAPPGVMVGIDGAELDALKCQRAKLLTAARQTSFYLRVAAKDDADAQLTLRILLDAIAASDPKP